MASEVNHLPKSGLVLLAGLTVFWGLNWPGMKIILSEVSVWWFRASCVTFGGCALLTLSMLAGHRWRPLPSEVWPLCRCALFNVVAWHLFSAYGVSNMAAGRASIIAFSMPLWATVFSAFLLGEPVTRAKALGLLLGLTGLCVLMGPDLYEAQQSMIGPLCMLGAALGWGLGTVLFKSRRWSLPVASNIGWQLVVSSIPLTLGAALLEPLPDIFQISDRAWLALIYIYVFPMTFCQWAYFKTVHLFPASIAATGTLLIPVVGVYSSSLLLAEQVGWREFLALLMICAALAFVLRPQVPRRPIRSTTAGP